MRRRRWRRSPRVAIERLPLSPAARLTGAASESASSARDKVFARLPWDPVLHVTVITVRFRGPGLCVYVWKTRSRTSSLWQLTM